VDVSGGYTFGNTPALTVNTVYRIIVIAKSDGGTWVQQIVVNTGVTSPVMDPLQISNITTTTIQLAAPTFSVVGVPAPTVRGWIGKNGLITVTGTTVSGTVIEGGAGGVDVSGGYTFGNTPALTVDTVYRIIVIAQSAGGTFVRQFTVNTSCIPPIMDNLILTPGGAGTAQITLSKPTFSVTGDPAPTSIEAYIGEEGFISVSGTTVSGTIIEGSINVSSSSYIFGVTPPPGNALTSGVTYRVIVISQGSCGYSVRQATAIAP
jgi:hypothetical protein